MFIHAPDEIIAGPPRFGCSSVKSGLLITLENENRKYHAIVEPNVREREIRDISTLEK
jgi:hypothetical protein